MFTIVIINKQEGLFQHSNVTDIKEKGKGKKIIVLYKYKMKRIQ